MENKLNIRKKIVGYKKVLIIGSAPTLTKYTSEIKKYDGEIWALNDALFWLEERKISVNKIFITDKRFISKSKERIEKGSCRVIFTFDGICDQLSDKFCINIMHNNGRDGFSMNDMDVYHGCSVFFPAVQVATTRGFKDISTCGVMFTPPGLYKRIDGSLNMPEYVYKYQIKNAKIMIRKLEDLNINIQIFEPESNLNFL